MLDSAEGCVFFLLLLDFLLEDADVALSGGPDGPTLGSGLDIAAGAFPFRLLVEAAGDCEGGFTDDSVTGF